MNFSAGLQNNALYRLPEIRDAAQMVNPSNDFGLACLEFQQMMPRMLHLETLE